ncbi:MAG: phosphoribosyl-ATP diphosphatase [Campylobacter sp.]|nr:phosphoribosyl-ATP diphosphatase [Campylobacter sp.]
MKAKNVSEQSTKPKYSLLDELYHVILDRKLNSTPEKSYVASLFAKGENQILKKVAEEAGEFIMACKEASFMRELKEYLPIEKSQLADSKMKSERNEVVYEAADLCFHAMVALVLHGIHPDMIKQELARRFGMSGIDEKNSRNK